MTKPDKAKLIVTFTSYGGFVLDSDKAMQIMEMLRGAEKFKAHYKHDQNGGITTYHVWAHDPGDSFVDFKYLTDEQYALAKVAGKPGD